MAFSFGNSTTKPTLSLGSTTTANNPAQSSSSGSLFMGLGPKQTTTTAAAPATTTTAPAGGSLFLGLPGKQDGANTNPFSQTTTTTTAGAANPAQTTQTQAQPTSTLDTSTLASGGPQIDIAHLRSTTKYDHLTPQLQQDILALDTAILNQIRQCADVSDLLPAVVNAGSQTAPAIDFVGTKLDELETGLENDAEAVVALRDGDLKKDEGEAKCVFRTVDRLKVPRQYQVGSGSTDVGAVPGAPFNGGLSGWWNQPQTFRGSSVRAAGAGLSVQLVDQELDDEKNKGPKSLVELFNTRTGEMAETSAQHTRLLGEIEDFVGGLEEKVYNKERELNERLDNGMTDDGEGGLLQERGRQMQLLRFVFGEVQRNLYEVAERIGSVRDGVVDVSMRR